MGVNTEEPFGDDELASEQVRRCKLPYIKVRTVSSFPREALKELPSSLAREHALIPVDKMGDVLSVATVDQRDQAVIDAVRAATGLRVRPFICTQSDLEWALAEWYPA